MKKFVMIALSNPKDGYEDEYNKWYSRRHLPEVLKVPGIVAATRYRLSDHQRTVASSPYRYLAVYQMETDDVTTALGVLSSRIRSGEIIMSDSISDDRLSYVFEEMTD